MPNFQANQNISIPPDIPTSYPHMKNHHDMMIKSHLFDVFISFISQFDGQNPVIMTFSPCKNAPVDGSETRFQTPHIYFCHSK